MSGSGGGTPPTQHPIMASPKLSVVIKREHCNTFRLLLIIDLLARSVMQQVFVWGAPEKNLLYTLKGYLFNIKGISNTQYRQAFNKTFRHKIEKDPTCGSFDVSLWLPAIQWGCQGLAPPTDDAWFRIPDTLEFHLKKIKDERNDLMHNDFSISFVTFRDKCEELRDLLKNILLKSRVRFVVDSAEVDQLLLDLNASIDRIRDTPLSQMDSESSEILPELMKDIGLSDLVRYLGRMSQVNPVTMIAGMNLLLDFERLYSTLELCQVGRNDRAEDIDSTELFEHVHQIEVNTNSSIKIILIEGGAGMGKTTLIRFLSSGWLAENSTIKDIEQFTFLFHMECRCASFECFSDLISFQLPTVKAQFPDKNDMVMWVLNHQCLLIIDGLDEMTHKSKLLFLDVMQYLQNSKLMVLCTTRTVKIDDFYRMVPSEIRTMHLKIKPVPSHLVYSFVKAYQHELRTCGFSQQNIDDDSLVIYLRTIASHLQDYLQVPLNLTMLTVMWEVNPECVNGVTTSIELYMQMHNLVLLKLYERLDKHESTRSLDHSVIKEEVRKCVDALGWEALMGLKEDALIMTDEAMERLESVCDAVGLPKAEVFGAFLIQETRWTPTGLNTISSFNHKSLQEFYASLYTSEKVIGNNSPHANVDEKRDLMKYLRSSNVPCHRWESIAQYIFQSGNATICGIFKDLHKTNFDPSMLPRYQNVLIQILGLFCQSKKEVSEILLKEAFELLKQAGMIRAEDWIRILNTVKVNTSVVTLISQVPGIMEDTVKITQSNVIAHCSLMQVQKPRQASLVICVNPFEVQKLKELMTIFIDNLCTTHTFFLFYSYYHPEHLFSNTWLEDATIQILEKCSVTQYVGRITTRMQIPRTLMWLVVSVADNESYLHLKTLLDQGLTSTLEYLDVCVPISIHRILGPLPSKEGNIDVSVNIPEVIPNDILRAVETFRKLQPIDGKRTFNSVGLLRAKLDSKQQMSFIQSLRDGKVNVQRDIFFPKSIQPSSEEDCEMIRDLAKRKLSCNVLWSPNYDI